MPTNSAKSQTHPLPTVFIIYFWHMQQVLNCGDIPVECTTKGANSEVQVGYLESQLGLNSLNKVSLKWYQEISRNDGHVYNERKWTIFICK
jgi:hypothetical protein